MATYSLKIKSSAAKEIRTLPRQDRERIVRAIDTLRDNPHIGTHLKGKTSGLRRIRVGTYRVIYDVEQGELLVLVLRVGHRRDVYR